MKARADPHSRERGGSGRFARGRQMSAPAPPMSPGGGAGGAIRHAKRPRGSGAIHGASCGPLEVGGAMEPGGAAGLDRRGPHQDRAAGTFRGPPPGARRRTLRVTRTSAPAPRSRAPRCEAAATSRARKPRTARWPKRGEGWPLWIRTGIAGAPTFHHGTAPHPVDRSGTRRPRGVPQRRMRWRASRLPWRWIRGRSRHW